MSDTQIEQGGPLPPEPNTWNPLFTTGALVGTAVAVSTVAGSVQPAKGDALAHAQAIGLTIQSPNAAGERGIVRYNGPVTLTAAQWELVTADASALTTGAAYYVSQSVAGQITKTKPDSGLVTVVGLATSPTTLFVQPSAVLQSSS